MGLARGPALVAWALLVAACGGDPSGPNRNARLTIGVTGLPAGVPARVTVTGPDGYRADVTQSGTLRGLRAGIYLVDARYVSAQGQTWLAPPSPDSVLLASADSVALGIGYVGAPASTLDLAVAGTELTQSVQRADGTVPMVAGRSAVLRVYAIANDANAVRAVVRVRLYQGGTVVDSTDVTPPSDSVPTSVANSPLSISWNVLIPAARMVPGLQYDVLVDPEDRVPETDKGDNRWPSGAEPQAVTVQSVPAFRLRFVPVAQTSTGQTGAIDNAAQGAFIAPTQQLFPLSSVTTDVRVPYTSSAPPAVPNDSNGAWSQILGEMNALRLTEDVNRHYMGVIKVSYTSGIAGLGYIGAKAAVSWDRSSSAPGIVAHELGHNFGRLHAPCGNPPGVDPSYPYAGGGIGTWGLAPSTLTLMDPAVYTDIMGYCNPKWVSDYTYLAVLASRNASPVQLPGPSVEGLLVWGRVGRGGIALEPAIAVRAPASLPEQPGPDLLEGMDAAGGRLFSLSFESEAVADLPDEGERQFAFVVPLSGAERGGLRVLRLTARGLTAIRSVPTTLRAGPAPAVAASARRIGAGTAVRWDPAYPLAVVRERATGAILSFARGGRALVVGGQTGVTIQLSDGVTGGVTPRAP